MQRLTNSLAGRLAIWFLLLSLLPIGVMAIFVRRTINDTFNTMVVDEMGYHAELLAAEVALLADADDLQPLLTAGSQENRAAGVVDTEGTYLAHSDVTQVGHSLLDYFSAPTVEEILGHAEGSTLDDSGYWISYFAVPQKDTIVLVITDEDMVSAPVATLERSAFGQISISLVLVTIAGGVAIGIMVAPIHKLVRGVQQVGVGDTEVEIDPADMEGELKLLAVAFNQMSTRLDDMLRSEQEQRERLQEANLQIEQRAATERAQREQLQSLILQIRDAAGNLDAASSGILAAATQQSAGSSEQSTAISQASSTIEEVSTIAEQMAQRAQAVADLSQETADASKTGQQAVEDTLNGMAEIKDKVETIASNNLSLSEQTQAISQIISSVNEIAAQSNLLALNAAVEAARVGAAGRGFAVVAQEVRSLAEQSKHATEQVREILSQIQQGVNTAVMTTEEGMKEADAGVNLARKAGTSIETLAHGVTESAQAAMQISAAAGQQLAGMKQIASAMQNIRQVAAQNVAGAQQVAQAAAELSALSAQLRELVEQHK